MKDVFIGGVTKLATALAVGALTFCLAPQAKASPLFSMCITDVAPPDGGNCSGADSLYVTMDGATLTITTTAAGTVSGITTSSHVFAGLTQLNVSGTVDGSFFSTEIGTLGNGGIDLSFNDTSAKAGTLWVQFDVDSFSKGAPFTLNPSGNGPMTNTVSACYVGSPLGSNQFCNGLASTVSVTAAGAIPTNPLLLPTTPSSPFGLGIELTLVATGGGQQNTGDINLAPAPEPATMLLIGGGLLGLGLISKRRKKA